MQKTTHYQLNQWDPEDRIMRVDFNGDNAAIDEALRENAQALETERQARAAGDNAANQATAAAKKAALDAVAAEESARKSAVTAEANTRSQQDAAIRQEFAAADTRLRSENMLVKLLDVTKTTAAQQYDLDVSGIDFSQYASVIVIPQVTTTSQYGSASFKIRFNNISSNIYNNTDSLYIIEGLGISDTVLTIHARGDVLFCSITNSTFSGTSSMNSGSKIVNILPKNLTASALRTINFAPSDTERGDKVSSGHFVVYGVKW